MKVNNYYYFSPDWNTMLMQLSLLECYLIFSESRLKSPGLNFSGILSRMLLLLSSNLMSMITTTLIVQILTEHTSFHGFLLLDWFLLFSQALFIHTTLLKRLEEDIKCENRELGCYGLESIQCWIIIILFIAIIQLQHKVTFNIFLQPSVKNKIIHSTLLFYYLCCNKLTYLLNKLVIITLSCQLILILSTLLKRNELCH